MLLGQVDGYFKVHGYYSGKCCQDECTDQNLLVPKIHPGLSGPTLFVQDELHLLKEGLGTFDAHYETFVQRLMQEFGQNQPLKIIASSATIEAFQRQVEHLYGRKPDLARVFPGLGPTQQTSFYAETLDYPQRLFLGLIPHNKTIFNAILELIQYYHESVQDLQRLPLGALNPYKGDIEPGTQDWQELLDPYATSMTYFLNTRFLHSIKTDLEGDTNTNLERCGYHLLSIAELTGSVSTHEVATTLARLEHPLPSPKEAIDTILATNMVSHGVDIDRLNAMIFYGMPAQAAEYIQSSSRVGRAHVGLVFMCLHPVRERDHLYVRRAALLCGLDRTSLNEYLLPKSLSCVVYSSHRFGQTIGALTALFEQSLQEWLTQVRDSRRCVYDPVCADQGGSCHACTHLSEISCQFFNLNLGRSFLFGGRDLEMGNITVGYFDPSLMRS